MEKRPDITLYLRSGLYLEYSYEKGRGLFCHEDIKEGETIEIAPAFVLTHKDDLVTEKTRIVDYVFSVSDMPPDVLERYGIKAGEKSAGFVLGMTSFCNHARLPNARADSIDDGHTTYFELAATRAIPKNTEICIDYGVSWLTRHRLWKHTLAMEKKEEKEKAREKDG